MNLPKTLQSLRETGKKRGSNLLTLGLQGLIVLPLETHTSRETHTTFGTPENYYLPDPYSFSTISGKSWSA